MSNDNKRLRCALTGQELEAHHKTIRMVFNGKRAYVLEYVLLQRIGTKSPFASKKQAGQSVLPGSPTPIRKRTPEENTTGAATELAIDDRLVRGDTRIAKLVEELFPDQIGEP